MPIHRLHKAIELTGTRSTALLQAVGHFSVFSLRTLALAARPPWRARLILTQAIQLGIRATPLAILTALFVGMVVVLQTGYQLAALNAKQYAAGGAAKALTQVMVPIFTAMVVGARTAASIAAELGTMRVTEQIDAMEVLDVEPVRYLVIPRVIASTLMLPVVTMYADFVGLLGGLVVGVMGLHVSVRLYLTTTFQFLTCSDIITGLAKTVFFGATMGLCGCYFGYHARGGAEGVGRATINAVVSTLMLLVALEYVLSSWSLYILDNLINRPLSQW